MIIGTVDGRAWEYAGDKVEGDLEYTDYIAYGSAVPVHRPGDDRNIYFISPSHIVWTLDD